MKSIIDEYGEAIVGVAIGIPLIGIALASLMVITINI